MTSANSMQRFGLAGCETCHPSGVRLKCGPASAQVGQHTRLEICVDTWCDRLRVRCGMGVNMVIGRGGEPYPVIDLMLRLSPLFAADTAFAS